MDININDWKEFEVGSLFNIRPTKRHNLVNRELFDDNGTTPVVVNSNFNNGIGGCTALETTEKAPIITFSDTTDAEAIFLQTEDFAGYSHIQCMNPIKYEDMWNELTLLFFQIIFKTKAKTMGFSYSNKFTKAAASSMVVLLPTKFNSKTQEYDPDWDYMEDFIRERKETNQDKISLLATYII